MTATVTIDDAIFAEAAALLHTEDPSQVIHRALASLARRRAAQMRLADLGGSMPNLEMPRRRPTGDYGE
jgi:hypothetical protein